MLKPSLRWRVDTDRVTVLGDNGEIIARASDPTAAMFITLAPVLVANFVERTMQDFARRQASKLNPTPCEICGRPDAQAHHEDYMKPLEVKWLCPPHHHAADKARRARLKQN